MEWLRWMRWTLLTVAVGHGAHVAHSLTTAARWRGEAAEATEVLAASAIPPGDYQPWTDAGPKAQPSPVRRDAHSLRVLRHQREVALALAARRTRDAVASAVLAGTVLFQLAFWWAVRRTVLAALRQHTGVRHARSDESAA